MIIYRLAEGRAWNSDTLDVTLTTFQFQDRMVEQKARTETMFTNDGNISYGPDPQTATTATQRWSISGNSEIIMTVGRRDPSPV